VSILTWNRLSRSLGVLSQTLRILLAPFQCLPDDFVFVRAREMPQEPLARSLVDKRGKRRPLRAPLCVQVDRIRTMIDALLKRCRVPHCFPDRHTLPPRNELAIAVWPQGWGILPASGVGALFLRGARCHPCGTAVRFCRDQRAERKEDAFRQTRYREAIGSFQLLSLCWLYQGACSSASR